MRLFILSIVLIFSSTAVAEELMPDGSISTNLIRLISQPEKYREKKVMLSGFYKSDFELSSLYLSRDDALAQNTEQALWIGSPKKDIKDIVYPKSAFIQVVGVFKYTPMQGAGHLGNWFGELSDIELLREIPTK